ncbi:hypothetical protein [Parafannyhessea umbonata]|uniref:hypothetical protein n=1 Tax=Parafannyhessea umbonata TaxID=604330 RepID=UPI001564B39A|nr:hypothetical protein [Parafannyhessea umbonata]MCI6681578.1 hypothetical protein [Parafannyhessea umbonata]MCI7218763.1 hypothetical protein [Parafannyhessea umbonata]
MIFGIGLPELGMSILAMMLELAIPAVLLLVVVYFVVRKAVRDELAKADQEQKQKS